MKKALTITIAGMLFTIEEDAYQKLDEYLKSIKKYFGNTVESTEIINDIEARIAEQFLDRANKDAVVSIEDVEKLIGVMGRVEDIADESNVGSDKKASAGPKEFNDGPRKLYRDTDNAYIAGVAAGIAEYLDIDPIIIRIAIVLLAIFTAIFPVIIIYAILTLVIPPARTPAEKIRMRGGPVDLQSFKESMNEYAQNLKKNGSEMKEHLKETGTEVKNNVNRFFANSSRSRGVIDRVFQILGKIIVIFFKVILAVVGFGIMLAGIAAVAFTSFVFVNLLVNPASPYIDFPFYGIVTGPLYVIMLLVGFLAIAIPFAFLISLGAAFITRKKTLNVTAALIMLGMWIISGIAFATIALRYAPAIEQRVLSAQESQQATKSFEVTDFSKVDIHGGDNVQIVPGETFAVVAQGKQIDLDALQVHVTDRRLVVRHDYDNKLCVFCFRDYGSRDITITMPSVEEIRATGATKVTTTASTTPKFFADAHGASHISFAFTGEELKVELSGASQVVATGTAAQLEVDASGASQFDGTNVTARTADLKASGASEIKVHVLETLEAKASGASKIEYKGSPASEIEESGASAIQQVN